MDDKELEYIPRKIGESWSCYWNTYKPRRSPVTVPQTDWNFFTPPYTPKTEVSPSASSEASTHSNTDQNRLNGVYSKESTTPSKNSIIDENVITIDDDIITIDSNEIKTEDNINPELLTKNNDFTMDITNPSASNQFPIDKLKNTCTSKNLENVQLNSNLKTVTTRAPTIVNIEKMNLVSVGDIKKLSSEKLILKNPEKCQMENTGVIKGMLKDSKKIILVKKVNRSQVLGNTSIGGENPVTKQSRVEVKTVKLEGLPVVTLSYEVPAFLNEVKPVPKEIKSEVTINTENEVNKPVQVLSNKSIMASKMFQKFDFGELRRLKNLKKNEEENNECPLDFKNKDVSNLKNSEVSNLKNKEVTNLEIKKVSILENKEVSISGNEESLIPKKEEITNSKNINISSPKNKISDSKNGEIVNLENEEISCLKKEETSSLKKEETSILKKEETSSPKNEEISNSAEAASVSNNQESLPNNNQVSQNKNLSELNNVENFGKNFSPLSEDSKDNVISELDSFLNDYIEDIEIGINENVDSNVNDDDWLSSLLV